MNVTYTLGEKSCTLLCGYFNSCHVDLSGLLCYSGFLNSCHFFSLVILSLAKKEVGVEGPHCNYRTGSLSFQLHQFLIHVL